ncbi:MAG: hypothetical protein ACE5IK_05910 [Acidobacteriota bacterium]
MNVIDCRRFGVHLHPLAGREVDGALALTLSCHAVRCHDCATKLESARRVHDMLETAARQPAVPPPTLVASIMHALPAVADRAGRRQAWAAGGAAAVAVGFLGVASLLAHSSGAFPVAAQFGAVRTALATVGGFLARCGGLLETAGGQMPRLPAPATRMASVSGLWTGLALTATGLLGTCAGLYLTAARYIATARRS